MIKKLLVFTLEITLQKDESYKNNPKIFFEKNIGAFNKMAKVSVRKIWHSISEYLLSSWT